MFEVGDIFRCQFAVSCDSQAGPGSEEEGPVGAPKPFAERLYGAPVFVAVGHEIGKVVVEGRVDHAIRLGGAAAQGLGSFQSASSHPQL